MLISSRRLGLSRLIERWLASKNMRRKVFRSLSRQGYHVHREFGDHSFIYDPSEAIGKMLDDYGDVNRAETVDIIRRGLAAAGRDSGGVYLELGANIGTQAIYAGLAFEFDRLMAVEPDPDTFKVLDMNVRINGLSERTQVFDVAVSDAAGTAQLQRSRRNTGVSTLRMNDAKGQVELLRGQIQTIEKNIRDMSVILKRSETSRETAEFMNKYKMEDIPAGLDRNLSVK